MVHKYLSVLLLCSVPLIGMERKLDEDIANDLRIELKWMDEDMALIEEFEERTGQDLPRSRATLADEGERAREEYFRRSEDFIETSEDTPYMKKQYKSALKRVKEGQPAPVELQEKAKEEQQAPSQVSPRLYAIERCSRQSDNNIRECLRKLVELCRSNK